MAPGHGRHALGEVEEPAVEVEADDILDVLPRAEQSAPVGRPWRCPTRRRPSGRRRAGPGRDRVRLEDRVAVDHHDAGRARGPQPGVQRGRLARVLLADHRGRPAGRSASTMSAVPSVEPSSTTMISTRVVGCDERADRGLDAGASLYAGTITLTGSVTGWPPAPGARRPGVHAVRRGDDDGERARSTLMRAAATATSDQRVTTQSLSRMPRPMAAAARPRSTGWRRAAGRPTRVADGRRT